MLFDLIARAIFSFRKQNENAHRQNFHLTPYLPTGKSDKNSNNYLWAERLWKLTWENILLQETGK